MIINNEQDTITDAQLENALKTLAEKMRKNSTAMPTEMANILENYFWEFYTDTITE